MNQYENTNVVTIVAPFSIMKVDPEISARALHCIITVIKSEMAGIMKIFVEYVVGSGLELGVK